MIAATAIVMTGSLATARWNHNATLLPTGVIEIRFAAAVGLKDAVVGLSPGHTGQFSTADLSAASGTAGPSMALGERCPRRRHAEAQQFACDDQR